MLCIRAKSRLHGRKPCDSDSNNNPSHPARLSSIPDDRRSSFVSVPPIPPFRLRCLLAHQPRVLRYARPSHAAPLVIGLHDMQQWTCDLGGYGFMMCIPSDDLSGDGGLHAWHKLNLMECSCNCSHHGACSISLFSASISAGI